MLSECGEDKGGDQMSYNDYVAAIVAINNDRYKATREALAHGTYDAERKTIWAHYIADLKALLASREEATK